MDALLSLFPPGRALVADSVLLIGGRRTDELAGGLGAHCTYDHRPPAVADYLDALGGAAREHLPAEAGIADRLDAADGETVTVVGRHRESGDFLVDGVRLDAPRVGDLLAVPATGAYCFTMGINYHANRRIPVLFAAAGDARLVVRRETWADLLARDID